jgi:hypothetical protein
MCKGSAPGIGGQVDALPSLWAGTIVLANALREAGIVDLAGKENVEGL